MARTPEEIKIVHRSADYYEPLFRARFVRSMKALRQTVSRTAIQMAVARQRAVKDVIPRSDIIKALAPAEKVLRDAFRRGGQLGAEHVKKTLNG